VLSCHDRRDEWGDNIGETLVGPNDWGGCVGFIVVGSVEFLGRIGVVVLVRVGGQRAHPNGDTGGLEVGRVQGNDANNVVVVRLQVLDRDGGFLGRYVADCRVSVLLACVPWLRTINAVDPDDIFQYSQSLIRRFPVQQNTVGL
jgi:hypothetical protein